MYDLIKIRYPEHSSKFQETTGHLRKPRLGCAAHLQRDLRGMGQPSTTLPAARRGRDASVAKFFKQFSLNSRSCCLTGRLMRRMSPMVRVIADLRLPLFFTVRTQCTTATSVLVWGGGKGQGRGRGTNALDQPRPLAPDIVCNHLLT